MSNGQRSSSGWVIGLAALILIVGGTAAWLTWKSTAPTPTPVVSPTSSVVTAEKLEIYWLQANQGSLKFSPTLIKLSDLDPGDRTPASVLKAGLERLLAGPANPNLTTTIPIGTQLNSLKVESDGVHLDLSKEFLSGGGSVSMQGRLGQIIYTASSLDPKAKVWVSIAGEPLKVLGGEGLEVQQPMTRQLFEQDFQIGS
ncbi:MAG: GerMN domain-containing protein [Aphanocapsa sp. GSE-SYN-MK-11-07L]|jgi:spore germination protein GerM|nr:GerMN domain-containing protein [Aphanocapsa sp. GSE-SYN-MK-11-07L]